MHYSLTPPIPFSFIKSGALQELKLHLYTRLTYPTPSRYLLQFVCRRIFLFLSHFIFAWGNRNSALDATFPLTVLLLLDMSEVWMSERYKHLVRSR